LVLVVQGALQDQAIEVQAVKIQFLVPLQQLVVVQALLVEIAGPVL
jgi:hypothetical protein